jgi:hypothetical protein
MAVKVPADFRIVDYVAKSVGVTPISIAAIGSSRRAELLPSGCDLDVVVVVQSLKEVNVQLDQRFDTRGMIVDEQGTRFESKGAIGDAPLDLTVIDPSSTRSNGDPTRDSYEVFLGMCLNARTIDGLSLAESQSLGDRLKRWDEVAPLRLARVNRKIELTKLKLRDRISLFTVLELEALTFTRMCIETRTFPPCSVKRAHEAFPDFQYEVARELADCGVVVSVTRIAGCEAGASV